MRLAIAAWLLALPALAGDAVLDFDPAQTQVNFTLSDVLHTVRGSFRLKKGEIRFDPATGTAAGELVVDATSGDSGSHARDSRMHKNILESGKYPEIVFTPDHVDGRVSLDGDSEVRVHGMFSIHGGTHELVLPVTVHSAGGAMKVKAAFRVPYVKWGMKNPSTLFLRVGDEVQIEIEGSGRLTRP